MFLHFEALCLFAYTWTIGAQDHACYWIIFLLLLFVLNVKFFNQ